MFDLIIFIVLSLIFWYTVFLNIKITRHNKALKVELMQLALDKAVISQKLSEVNAKPIEDKEAFVKFLSDSREMAFQYIKDVQEKLENMVDELDSSVEYFNNYGIVSQGYPNYEFCKKFVKHYEELKTMIPEDDNNGS